MSSFKVNIIRFVPDDLGDNDEPLFLTVDSAFELSGGLKPNINAANISYREFDKLKGHIDRVGRIEFFYNDDPLTEEHAQPGLTLGKWRIIDVEAVKTGEIHDPASLIGVPSDSTSGNVFRIVEYRVYFADFREQFIFPRGGRLRLGFINELIKPEDDAPDIDSDVPELSLSDLIDACLDAMGLSETEIPDGVDLIDAPRDVKWFGNHAPTELAKLLDLAGLIFCPELDGAGARLEFIVTKGSPQAPNDADAALLDIQIPAIDRRGKTIIFSSYPLQTTETQTMNGPGSDWEFVLQDRTGKWVSLGDCDILDPYAQGSPSGDLTLMAAFNDNFKKIDFKYFDQLSKTAFRFIRLKDDRTKRPPAKIAPVLRRVIESDGSLNDLMVLAEIGIFDFRQRQHVNATAPLPIMATFMNDGNILQLDAPLMRVLNPPQPSIVGFGIALADDAFSIRFTVPKCNHVPAQDDIGGLVWVPDFFHAGFRRKPAGAGGSTIEQLSDSDVQNALTNGGGSQDLIYVTRPDLRLRWVDGEPANITKITKTAKSLADKFLANSSDPTRRSQWKGFVAVKLDGLTSAVAWDQAKVSTTATLNDWYKPSGALDLATLIRGESGDMGEDAYPNQGIIQEPRIAMGESGAAQPMVPLQPMPPANVQAAASTLQYVALSADGGGDGTQTSPPTYTYTVTPLSGGSALATQLPWTTRNTGNGSYASAGRGIIDTSGSSPVIVWAGEMANTGGCA